MNATTFYFVTTAQRDKIGGGCSQCGAPASACVLGHISFAGGLYATALSCARCAAAAVLTGAGHIDARLEGVKS